MSVLAFVRDTSTVSTPGSFCMATRTAWAQTAQSIPRVLTSMRRNSAAAAEGKASTVRTTVMRPRTLFIAILLFEPEKVTDIDRETDPFFGGLGRGTLIQGKQHSAGNTVLLI